MCEFRRRERERERERALKQTTLGLVGVGQLQHAAKLRPHSWEGANCLFGRNAHCISFQGVQYILVTCIRFFFSLFLSKNKQPNVIVERSSDKLFPLSPCPTQLIKY